MLTKHACKNQQTHKTEHLSIILMYNPIGKHSGRSKYILKYEYTAHEFFHLKVCEEFS